MTWVAKILKKKLFSLQSNHQPFSKIERDVNLIHPRQRLKVLQTIPIEFTLFRVVCLWKNSHVYSQASSHTRINAYKAFAEDHLLPTRNIIHLCKKRKKLGVAIESIIFFIIPSLWKIFSDLHSSFRAFSYRVCAFE